jgi:hypothetical protein
MKKTLKSQERELTLTAAPRPKEENPGLKLRIEELEPRLAPQSTTSILD